MKNVVKIKEVNSGYYISSDNKYNFVFMINSPNFNLLSNFEKELEVDKMSNVIGMVENLRFYCLDQHDNLTYFANNIKEENINYTDIQLELIDELKNKFMNEVYFEKKYYITYSSKDLKDYDNILRVIRDCGIEISELGYRGVEVFLYNLLIRDHQENKFDLYDEKYINRIIPSTIKVKTDSLIVDNIYRKYLILKNLPSNTKIGYLNSLLNKRNINALISTSLPNQKEVSQKIQSRLRYANDMSNENKISDIDKAHYKIEAEGINSIIEKVTNENKLYIQFDIIFEITGETLEEYNKVYDEFIIFVQNLGITVNHLDLQQMDMFKNFVNCNSKMTSEYSHVNVSTNYASLYPFNKATKIEDDGVYYGSALVNGNTEGMLILNPKSKYLKNYNVTVIGTSGAGKSVTLKKIILNNSLKKNYKIFSFDSDGREYFDVTNCYGGKNVDASQNSINILQYRYNELSQTEYVENINLIKKFIKIYDDTVTNNMNLILEIFLKLLYANKNIIVKNSDGKYVDNPEIVSFKANDFPIFSDLYDLLNEMDGQNKILELEINEHDFKRLKNIIYSLSSGIDGNYFNKHSTINLDVKGINFDILNIREYEKNLFSSILYTYLTYIWKYISTNDNNGQFKQLVIDELHLLINPESLYASREISAIIKRIRKYNGGVISATQQFNDLMHEDIKLYASNILSNSDTKFLYNLGDVSYKDINSIIPITEQEYKLIQKSKSLQGILRFGRERFYFQLDILKTESKAFGEAGR